MIMVTYHGTVVSYTENPDNGLARAELNITIDDDIEVVANIAISDKIADIQERIKTDLAQAIEQIKGENQATPPQPVYDVADDGTVS